MENDASMNRLYDALRAADAAGNTDDAKKLAQYIRQRQTDSKPVAAAAQKQEYRAPTVADIPSNAPIHGFQGEKVSTAPTPAKKDSFYEAHYGLLEAPTTVLTGMGGALVGSLAGAGKTLLSGKYGTQEGIREGDKLAGEIAEAMTYQPRTQTGKGIVQGIGKALTDSGVAGLPIGAELMAATRLAGPAAAQVAKPFKNIRDPRVLPRIDPEEARLLALADKKGIRISPDMLSDNKYARVAGETARKIPLSGSADAANQVAFNRSVIGLIGGDRLKKRLTSDVYSEAMEKSGGKIGEIAQKYDIPVTDDIASSMSSVIGNAAKFETDDVGRVVANYASEILDKAAANGGAVDGVTYRKWNTAIGRKMRNTTDGDLKAALGDLQDVMFDGLQKSMSDPSDLAALLDARKKYAIGKTLEPLVAKSPLGDISPAALMGRVTANSSGKTAMAMGYGGELGDLAKIGQRYLKEPSTAMTAERATVLGLAGAGGAGAAYIEPISATAAFTAANLYNRLSPLVTRRIANNSLAGAGPRIAPQGLELADEAAYAGAASQAVDNAPYSGLLSAEQQPFNVPGKPYDQLNMPAADFPLLDSGGPLPIQKSGQPAPSAVEGMTTSYDNGVDFYGNVKAPEVAPVQPSPIMSLADQGPIPPKGSGVPDTQRMATTHDYPTMDFPLRQEVLQQPEIVSAITDFRTEAARLQQIAENAINPIQRNKAAQQLSQLQAEFSLGMEQLGISNAADATGINRPLYDTGSGTRMQITRTMDRVARQRALENLSKAKTVDEAILSIMPKDQP